MSITLKDLQKRKVDFNTKIWKDYNLLRKETHQRITEAEQSVKTQQREINKKFIQAAINNAGEAQLSDQLILDKVMYDSIIRQWVVTPEVRNVDAPRIKNFHAIAMLRNPEHYKDRPQYKNDQLLLASIALKTQPTQADTDFLDDLKSLMNELDYFKDELQGKGLIEIDNERSPYGSPAKTAIEMLEHMKRAYPDKKVSEMTNKQAQKIMEACQSKTVSTFPDAEDMKRHRKSYGGSDPELASGKMAYHGPRGKSVINQ